MGYAINKMAEALRKADACDKRPWVLRKRESSEYLCYLRKIGAKSLTID